MALIPCTDLAAASWIADSNRPSSTLITIGPPGLPAYARLRFIPDPSHPGQTENDAEPRAGAPSEAEQLRIVLDTLARYTATPGRCYVCLWDGWGSATHGGDGARIADYETRSVRRGPLTAPAFPRSVLDGPKVTIPNRAYYLFTGALADVGDWGAADMWPGQPRTQMPNPAFIWPADRRWCVTDDVDPHWAGIGADAAAIDELIADRRLDVVAADPREDPPRYA